MGMPRFPHVIADSADSSGKADWARSLLPMTSLSRRTLQILAHIIQFRLFPVRFKIACIARYWSYCVQWWQFPRYALSRYIQQVNVLPDLLSPLWRQSPGLTVLTNISSKAGVTQLIRKPLHCLCSNASR